MSYLCWAGLGNEWLNVVITHPIEYANLLIRIGYEPCPPVIKKNIFGQDILCLPGLGSYLKHIYNVDGFMGFLPGLNARLIIATLHHLSVRKVNDIYLLPNENECDNTEEDYSNNKKLLKKLSKVVLSVTAGNIISHPFYVVAFRSMAQFVGRETKYDTIWSSLKIIYTEQGFDGLYSGFLPRLFRDLSNVIIITCISFVMRTYVTKRKDIQTASNCLFQLFIRNITYPFHVIATCLAVNDPGLKAGSPPALPIFKGGWLDCWSYLAETNQLTRGLYPILQYKKIPTSKPTILTNKRINLELDTPVIEEPKLVLSDDLFKMVSDRGTDDNDNNISDIVTENGNDVIYNIEDKELESVEVRKEEEEEENIFQDDDDNDYNEELEIITGIEHEEEEEEDEEGIEELLREFDE